MIALVLGSGLSSALGGEEKTKDDARPQAPGDSRIFERDLAGAFFISRPLMEKYEALRSRINALRADIDEARIDGAKARDEVKALQLELSNLLQTIDQTKLYIPGAQIHERTDVSHIAIQPGDVLLVDCENISIRGWDGPDIKCVLEKVVLDDGTGNIADDFSGIKLIARQSSGKELFGFYLDVRDLPKFKDNEDLQGELRRFVFPEFLGRQFPYITVNGLIHEEGNRQIEVNVRSERGDGFSSSQWRRHATLTLFVPKCQRIGIRGALGQLKVQDLDAGLSVLGQGNRDYESVYEVANLGGSLVVDNVPIQRIESVKGNVSVSATAYTENRGTGHGPSGAVFSANAPRDSFFGNIDGDLRVRFCRANLTIGDVRGRIDVENEFGNTLWQTDRELAQKADHRVLSQSGAITVRFGSKAAGKLMVDLFTECGSLRRESGIEKVQNVWFEETSFQTAQGDQKRRAWTCWTRRPGPEDRSRRNWEETFAHTRRAADALAGRLRSPGVDVISRAGLISVTLPESESRGGK
jgi:hypothetical protein